MNNSHYLKWKQESEWNSVLKSKAEKGKIQSVPCFSNDRLCKGSIFAKKISQPDGKRSQTPLHRNYRLFPVEVMCDYNSEGFFGQMSQALVGEGNGKQPVTAVWCLKQAETHMDFLTSKHKNSSGVNKISTDHKPKLSHWFSPDFVTLLIPWYFAFFSWWLPLVSFA